MEDDDEAVEVGVARQEHAEETREALPPQLETNVGSAADAEEAVYVGQNADTADDSRIICLRQLSWLQFGAITEGVAVAIVVGVAVAVVDSFL